MRSAMQSKAVRLAGNVGHDPAASVRQGSPQPIAVPVHSIISEKSYVRGQRWDTKTPSPLWVLSPLRNRAGRILARFKDGPADRLSLSLNRYRALHRHAMHHAALTVIVVQWVVQRTSIITQRLIPASIETDM